MQIEINNVSFSYQKSGSVTSKALNNVSFNIDKGEFLTIVGKTGSGKSTLIQMLNGLLSPDEGYIKIDDYIVCGNKKYKKSLLKSCSKDIKKMNKNMSGLKKKVGLVFQFPEYQLFSETILKDCMFGPKNFGLNNEEAKKVSEESLIKVGLDDSFFSRSPFELSGGEKRRVGIAGVLAFKPEILVLDEPTAGLDSYGKKEIMNLIKQYNEEGNTVIVVTHDMDLVLNYASKVIVMDEGKLIKETTPSKLFKESDLSKYSLEEPDVFKLIKILNDKGFHIDFDSYSSIDTLINSICEDLK